MTDCPLFVVLSGPSGVGKDTLLRALLARDDRITGVVTAKTRARRPGERQGVDHLFLDDDDFEVMVQHDEFLEHAIVYGHRSGVPREPVREALERGLTVVARTDIQGARTLRDSVPGALLIFITAPDLPTLERRLRSRDDVPEADLRNRLSLAREEIAAAAEFDYVVINRDDAEDTAVNEVLAILQEERARPDRLLPQV